jgi:hypothetical protein
MTFNASVNPDNTHFSQSGSILSLKGNVPLTYATDAGSAAAASHVLNVLGTAGASTSASGNTITVSATSSSVSPDPFDPSSLFLPENVLNHCWTDIGWSAPASAVQDGTDGWGIGISGTAELVDDFTTYTQCGGRLGVISLNPSPGSTNDCTIRRGDTGLYWTNTSDQQSNAAVGWDFYIDQVADWGVNGELWFFIGAAVVSSMAVSSVKTGVQIYAKQSSSPNWFIQCRATPGGALTSTNTGIAIGTGWHKVAIAFNKTGTLIECFLDNSSLGTFSTNLPIDQTNPEFAMRSRDNKAQVLLDTIYYLNDANEYI